jgi:hypothetical protein
MHACLTVDVDQSAECSQQFIVFDRSPGFLARPSWATFPCHKSRTVLAHGDGSAEVTQQKQADLLDQRKRLRAPERDGSYSFALRHRIPRIAALEPCLEQLHIPHQYLRTLDDADLVEVRCVAHRLGDGRRALDHPPVMLPCGLPKPAMPQPLPSAAATASPVAGLGPRHRGASPKACHGNKSSPES